MKYKIICKNNPNTLEQEVNDLLCKGWKLSGSHQMTDNERSQYFSQALTYDNNSSHDEPKRFSMDEDDF